MNSVDLTLAAAQALVEAALSLARDRGLSVAVAICGPAGDLRAFARMDTVAPLAGETARRKCWTVIMTGRSTREFGERMRGWQETEPEVFHGMVRIGEMAPIAGGVPIRFGTSLIGAIGVSGASSVDDHEVAVAAIESASPTA